jgi:prephenate dehydrogenase
MTGFSFEKIALLGVGLIGASVARAAKKKGLCGEVVGYGRSRGNLMRAKEKGILDAFEETAAAACEGADLIVLSAPVGAFYGLVESAAASFRTGAVVTDTGSVKGELVYEMERLMPAGVSFIGGHPIAGSDRSGIDASSDDLFVSAKCIVTPTERSDKSALEKVMALWRAFGPEVVTMDPHRHDRIYASVSHLPHLIAYTLVNTAAELEPSSLAFSGRGFLDTTRIAASSHELWRDICLMNRENMLEAIRLFRRNLDELSGYLAASDADSLDREFLKARKLRGAIGQD